MDSLSFMIDLFKTSTFQMKKKKEEEGEGRREGEKRVGVVEDQLNKCPGRNLKMKMAFTSKFWLFWLQGKDFFFFFLRKLSLYQSSYTISQPMGLAQK